MGDRRFDASYERLLESRDRASAIRAMSDADVIHALAAASRRVDAYLANVLAVEAINRHRRQRAFLGGLVVAFGSAVAMRSVLIVKAGTGAYTAFDAALLYTSLAVLVPAAVLGFATWWLLLRRSA